MLDFRLTPYAAERGYRLDALGLVPHFFWNSDPRPAKDQLADRYAHGGGYRPIAGFTMDPDTADLQFIGDPPFRAVAEAWLRTERLLFYSNCSLLAIVQPDGSFVVTRVD